MIRSATRADLPLIQSIERAAGQPFRAIGMAAVADDEPPSLEALDAYRRGGRVWVWTDASDRPVGYVLVDVVDGNGHVEQVSVRPDHAGHRIGAALVERAARWARAEGYPALTLTTFTDVPWNGPYYERLAFRHLPETRWTPGLRSLRAEEAAHGLDRWPRGCMRREL